MPSLSQLESRIGYAFQNEALLRQALTHRSFSEDNNERLEFLGDAILSQVVAAELYEQFPDASEGDLSRLRARLVKQSTLASIARKLELGELLIMGSGEIKSGGFKRDSILSDALEALVGAIYTDSGIDAATRCVLNLFHDRLDNLDANNIQKDAKSRLQEYLQGVGESVPEYVLVRASGKSPHQEFEIGCRSPTLKERITGKGSSRRRAEQAAAALALVSLGVDS